MLIDEKLEQYAKSNTYPFHMPGHKRQALGEIKPYSIDITEITDFDDLNDPKGIIAELQQGIANLYGTDFAYLLVGGSTEGNLSSIFAATKQGDKILMGRNCHKSVYNAAEIRALKTEYLYPIDSIDDIPGPINPMDVFQALKSDSDIKSVVITSPTYEGVISDITSIAEICHEFGVSLIVDAAHGAHFGLHKSQPANPINQGADAVIMSWHKTLPAFTQTAVVLMNKESLIDRARLEKYVHMFGTSSPSYVFMAGAAKCLRFLQEDGEMAFSLYDKKLKAFYEDMKSLKNVRVIDRSDKDPSKIIISGKNTSISGHEMTAVLHEEYHIELEMACFSYALALSSVMDTDEGFNRLSEALKQIDMMVTSTETFELEAPKPIAAAMTLSEAASKEYELKSLNEAIGRVASQMIFIYPPGAPIVAPGEIVTEDAVEYISVANEMGLTVTGLTKDNMVTLVKE